jgi:hypothetical protein
MMNVAAMTDDIERSRQAPLHVADTQRAAEELARMSGELQSTVRRFGV